MAKQQHIAPAVWPPALPDKVDAYLPDKVDAYLPDKVGAALSSNSRIIKFNSGERPPNVPNVDGFVYYCEFGTHSKVGKAKELASIRKRYNTSHLTFDITVFDCSGYSNHIVERTVQQKLKDFGEHIHGEKFSSNIEDNFINIVIEYFETHGSSLLKIGLYKDGIIQHRLADVDATVDFLSQERPKARKSLVIKAIQSGRVYNWDMRYDEKGFLPRSLIKMRFASYVNGALERTFHNVSSIVKLLKLQNVKGVNSGVIYKHVQTPYIIFGRRWVFVSNDSFSNNIPKYAVYRHGVLQKRLETEEDAKTWLKENKLHTTNFSLETAITKHFYKGIVWKYNESGSFPSNLNDVDDIDDVNDIN
jgi:hypothetical protein